MSYNDSNINETIAAAFGRNLDETPSYRTASLGSQNNFSILTKIVKFLKEKHLNSDSDPLTLEEILDETEQIGVSTRTKTWLENEALPQNPRIRAVTDEGQNKYQFKPVIDVKDRKSLREYLAKKYQSGEGAIWMEDILDSLPRANKAIKMLSESGQIVVITRQDKKKVVFFNESREDIKIDEEFIKLWRTISVDGVADDKIEEYLKLQGIKSIQDSRKPEQVIEPRKRRKVMRKNFKSHNEHMANIFEDYSEK